MEEAGAWLAGVEAGECDLPLDELISSGCKHLFILETCASCVGSSHKLSVSKCMDPIANWIGRWEAAAVEAETLGLGRDISYKYWQKNIELPEVFTKAQKWFDTAEKLAKAVDPSRLVKFACDGERHVWAVEACRSSWPRFRHWSITQSFIKWNTLLVEWCELASTASDQVQAERPDVATMDLITQQLDNARDVLEDAIADQKKMERRVRKADMLKKRTCSHCGKTGPLSQLSFAYCGGCRHAGIARIDLPRYCSEACQRAHWAAGHKHECPCAKDL